jgi:hypothetical protein
MPFKRSPSSTSLPRKTAGSGYEHHFARGQRIRRNWIRVAQPAYATRLPRQINMCLRYGLPPNDDMSLVTPCITNTNRPFVEFADQMSRQATEHMQKTVSVRLAREKIRLQVARFAYTKRECGGSTVRLSQIFRKIVRNSSSN